MTKSATSATRYLGGWPMIVEVGGRSLSVTVHLAVVRGRMTCVGIDVRSFSPKIGVRAPSELVDVEPMDGDWVEITSPLFRSVRTAEVIEAAVKQWQSGIGEFVERAAVSALAIGHPELAEKLMDGIGRLVGEEPPVPPRRGPKPLLDETILRDVVAPTYLMAAKKPVQAVRLALAEAVPAYKGNVSPDVARKAVATARARGFIPPVRRPEQMEGQP